MKQLSFKANIDKIGINPFVFIPEKILKQLFIQANKTKGKIPVKIKIDGHEFSQTLVKFSGEWRLYINTPMRRAAGKDVGDKALFEIEYDKTNRTIEMHPALKKMLSKDKELNEKFKALQPSLQFEIIKYLSFLKTPESIQKNIEKISFYLQGKGEFLGRTLN